MNIFDVELVPFQADQISGATAFQSSPANSNSASRPVHTSSGDLSFPETTGLRTQVTTASNSQWQGPISLNGDKVSQINPPKNGSIYQPDTAVTVASNSGSQSIPQTINTGMLPYTVNSGVHQTIEEETWKTAALFDGPGSSFG